MAVSAFKTMLSNLRIPKTECTPPTVTSVLGTLGASNKLNSTQDYIISLYVVIRKLNLKMIQVLDKFQVLDCGINSHQPTCTSPMPYRAVQTSCSSGK
jgi:hypothetical protein